MQKNRSEVAALREQVTAEYMAAKLGLQGLSAGTSRHQIITARQERIEALHEELQKLVGDKAIARKNMPQTYAILTSQPYFILIRRYHREFRLFRQGQNSAKASQ